MDREKKNMFLILAGLAVSQIGSVVFTFALSLYVLKLTGSAQDFATTLTLGTVPRIILGPFVGNLADRANKKMIIVLSDIMSGIIMFTLLFYSVNAGLSINVIYIGSFLLAICSTFMNNTLSAAIPGIVRTENLTKLNSWIYGLTSLINMTAPAFGGLIYGLVSIEFFLAVNGLSFILSGISEFFIDFNFKPHNEKIEQKSFIEDLKGGLLYFSKQKLLLSLSVYTVFISFFIGAINVILPYALVEELQVTEKSYGIIMSFFPLGVLIGAVLAGKMNIVVSFRLLSSSLIMIAVSFLIYSRLTFLNCSGPVFSVIGFGATGVLISLFSTVINIPFGVYLQTVIDRHYMGRVMSLLGTCSAAIVPFSYMIYGFFLKFCKSWTLFAVSALGLFCILFFMSFNKNIKSMEA